jgi:hypothetical protein
MAPSYEKEIQEGAPTKQEHVVTQLIAAICLTTIAIGLVFLVRQAAIAFLNYIVPPF